MQRKDFRQRLSLTAVQVGRRIIDAEQGRNVEPIRSEGNRGGCVVADLYRILGVERPYLFEILEGAFVAGKRLELVIRVADARVQSCPVLRDRGRIIAVKDFTLRPFHSTVTGRTKLLKDLSSG